MGHRPPMVDIPVNVGSAGIFSHGKDPFFASGAARIGAAIGQGAKGIQSLPGFTEVFGPREALPAAPQPAAAVPAISPLTFPRGPPAQQPPMGSKGYLPSSSSSVSLVLNPSSSALSSSRKRTSDALGDGPALETTTTTLPRIPGSSTAPPMHLTPVLSSSTDASSLSPARSAISSAGSAWSTFSNQAPPPPPPPPLLGSSQLLSSSAPEAVTAGRLGGGGGGGGGLGFIRLGSNPSPPRNANKRPRTERNGDFNAVLDISGVPKLEGEESDRVMVFDTCDMVRSKIRHLFRNHSTITQAAFLRAIAATYSDGRRLQGAQLNRFLAMKGPNSGNTSGIFYASYVFFEKLRIRDGRPKSEDRLVMEKEYPNGFNVTDIKSSSNSYITVFNDEKVLGYDKYGRLKFAEFERSMV